MPATGLTLPLPHPDATSELAQAIASNLAAGDTILLEGDVGAGKSHFARSLILSLLTVPEDIPSPTFTLVQTYDTPNGAIWHADLYRLSDVQEVEELGLVEAFETAICLVEWPDRLGTLCPPNALTLTLAPGESDDARLLTARWSDPKWVRKLQGFGA